MTQTMNAPMIAEIASATYGCGVDGKLAPIVMATEMVPGPTVSGSVNG